MDSLQPGVIAQLLKELKNLQQDAIDGVKVCWELLLSEKPLVPNFLRSLPCIPSPYSAVASFSRAQVIINESNLADIQAEYQGPAGTPFEGGVFRMKLVLGSEFPSAPPKGKQSSAL